MVGFERPTAGTLPTASPDFPLSGPLALPMLLGLAMIGPLFSQSAWNNVTFTGFGDPKPGPDAAHWP